MIASSGTQTANVLFSSQAQVVDAIKTGTTQTSNVLYSGGAQTARLLNNIGTNPQCNPNITNTCQNPPINAPAIIGLKV